MLFKTVLLFSALATTAASGVVNCQGGALCTQAGLCSPSSLASPSSQPPSIPGQTVSRLAAVLINTGSTNTVGYTVIVGIDGSASISDAKGRREGLLPASLNQKFFTDLQAATPLSALPVTGCPKSASFGTSTYLQQSGERSPDLDPACPQSDPRAQALQGDIQQINQALNLSDLPRQPGQPNPVNPAL